MKKGKIFALTTVLMALGLVACGEKKSNAAAESKEPVVTSTEAPVTSQEAPVSAEAPTSAEPATSSEQGNQKAVTITASVLVKEEGKVYVQVTGTQSNYTAAEFKWAWGIKADGDEGQFVVGSATPAATDFAAVTFDATTGAFTVKLCLTDQTAIVAGTMYRIYGGTQESYDVIAFTDENTAARDTTRSYYLRNDVQGALIYDAVQPIGLTEASIVEIAAADIPEGSACTTTGTFLKFGGDNINNLTEADIAALAADNKIGGDFQRVLKEGGNAWGVYAKHNHAATERFWKVEGTKVYMYLYVGFMEDGEGWMVHFDMVNGTSANLVMDSVLKGDTLYPSGNSGYRVYANKDLSGEANYHGCLGVHREHVHNPEVKSTVKNSDNKDVRNSLCACGEKTIAIDFKDYSTIGGTDGTNPYYMKKGESVTWKIKVDKAISGAKLYLGLIATSSDHLGRHLYNEAKHDQEHAGEEGYVNQNTATNPDTLEQDDYRFTIKVGTTDYPLTNTKTMKENGAVQNQVCYVEVTSVDLAAGENTITYTQGSTIGYRMKLNGEVRFVYKGEAVAIGDDVAPAHVHSWVAGTDGANSDGKVLKNSTCECGGKMVGIALTDCIAADTGNIESSGKMKKNSTTHWKIKAPVAGTYTMMMAAKLSGDYPTSNTPDTAFNSGYKVGVGETEGTCTISGKHYESDLALNNTDFKYYEVGTVTLPANEEVSVFFTIPSAQDYRLVNGEEVRFVYVPAE